MTSKKTYCPDCGKEIFKTRAEANLALRNMRNRHKTCRSVYQCEACGGFHVTHLTYREGRRRYRSKSHKKDGTMNGTKDGTKDGTKKSLSRKKAGKAGQWDKENPILSHPLSHAQRIDNQTNNPKMGQWDKENGKKQK